MLTKSPKKVQYFGFVFDTVLRIVVANKSKFVLREKKKFLITKPKNDKENCDKNFKLEYFSKKLFFLKKFA